MIYTLVVIYNKKCENSKSLKSLEEVSSKTQVIVFDNSTQDYSNQKYCEQKGYTYYSKEENIGLSKAYNYVVSKIVKDDEHFLIVLDDDTELSKSYWEEVFTSINNKENFDILLPVVFSNNRIISPAYVSNGCRIKEFQDKESIQTKEITAINSGMIIKTSLFNQIQYNEEMFLDYVDHYFMKEVRKNNVIIKVMNSEIKQSFSRDEKANKKSALFRFKIYKKDFKLYCKSCHNLFFYYLSICVLTLKYTFKYKSLKFIFS